MRNHRALRKNKKNLLLRALSDKGAVPIGDMTRLLYNRRGKRAQLSIVKLLSAYRSRDPAFGVCVRHGMVTWVSSGQGR